MRAKNYRGSVLNLALAVTALLAVLEPSSAATVTSYAGDQAGFEAATTSTTIPLPVNTSPVPQKTVTNAYLNMTFTSGAICNPINGDLCDVFFGDFTPRVAGNEFGMSGQEDFTIDLSQKVQAFGFNIFQPGFLGAQGCNTASCVDDTFRISIYNGGTLLRTIDYKPPTDDGVSEVVALGFFGVTSDTLFNRIAINDLTGNIDNEFFTNFMMSKVLTPPTGTVPEPGTLALLGLGLAGLAASRRRKH